MSQRIEEPRRRYKLRVNFVGIDAYDKDEDILPYRKLIYLAHSNERVGDMRRKIESMFASMNPEDGQRQVSRLRDSYMCDVSDEFLVSDVFDESPVVYAAMNGLSVLDNESLVSPSPDGTGYPDSANVSHIQLDGGPKRKRYAFTPQHTLHALNVNGALSATPSMIANDYNTDDQTGYSGPRKARRVNNSVSIYAVRGPESVSPEITPYVSRKDNSFTGRNFDMLSSVQMPVSNGKGVGSRSTIPSSPEIWGNREASSLMLSPQAILSRPEPNSTIIRQAPEASREMKTEVLAEDSQQPQPGANATNETPTQTKYSAEGLSASLPLVPRNGAVTAAHDKSAPAVASPEVNALPSHGIENVKSRETGDQQQTSSELLPLHPQPGIITDNTSTEKAPAAPNPTGAQQQPMDVDPQPKEEASESSSGPESGSGSTSSSEASVALAELVTTETPKPNQPGKGVAQKQNTPKKAAAATESNSKPTTTPQKTAKSPARPPPVSSPVASNPKAKMPGNKPVASSTKNPADKKDNVIEMSSSKLGSGSGSEAGSSGEGESSSGEEESSSGEEESSSGEEESGDEEKKSSSGEEESSSGEEESSSGEEVSEAEEKPAAAAVAANKTPTKKTGAAKPSDTPDTTATKRVTRQSQTKSYAGKKVESPSEESGNESGSGSGSDSGSGSGSESGSGSGSEPESESESEFSGAEDESDDSEVHATRKTKADVKPKQKAAVNGTSTPARPMQKISKDKIEEIPMSPTSASRRKVRLIKTPAVVPKSENSGSSSDDDTSPRHLTKIPVLGTPDKATRNSSRVPKPAKPQGLRFGQNSGSGIVSISQLASSKPYDDLRKSMAKKAASAAAPKSQNEPNGSTASAGAEPEDESSGSDTDSGSDSDMSDFVSGKQDPSMSGARMAAVGGRKMPIRFAGTKTLSASAKARRRKSALLSL
ncbi:hypothetical protein EV175_003265 [Coemansia sp. RSA 1933]|nr:hypothetical protein EV175_003265 [Coemansia sp. RSA 1933]